MAFKQINKYNEEKYGNFFTLANDGNSSDVVFLYQGTSDVLVANVHYIKSADYSGYVHCCGSGCPACAKGIRVQEKLFIPLYNIADRKIQFFDRSLRFEPQLNNDVFASYPNPSEYVFRITRHGAAYSVDTTYEIRAVGKNTPAMSYAKILADNNATMPDYYENVCKDLTPQELSTMLNANTSVPTQDYGYVPTPRASSSASQPYVAPEPVNIPEPVNVPTPEYMAPPTDINIPSDDSTDTLDDDVNF